MKVQVYPTSDDLGRAAAQRCASLLNDYVKAQGEARLLLSTGNSQLDTLKHLVKMDVAWEQVTMFHLDEYVDLSDNHPASFRKYLREKFTELVPLKRAVFVSGEGDVEDNIRQLSNEVQQAPIDVALVGIGENGHIAFNDPPADFDTQEAYIVVELDERCKQQQVGEGWFTDLDSVPKRAVTMTVQQILKSKTILSCVPYGVKAKAVKSALEQDVTPMVPATILQTHPDVTLFLDRESSAQVSPEVLRKYTSDEAQKPV